MKKLEKIEHWKALILRQKESENSISQFCEDNNLVKGQFHYWKSRLDRPGHTKESPFSKVILKDDGRAGALDPIWVARFLKELLR